MPLSRNHSPMAAAGVRSARNCIGAGSDAVAAMTMVYSKRTLVGERLHRLAQRSSAFDRWQHRCSKSLSLSLVPDVVHLLLVQDGVENDGGLAGLAVTDDQLTLATANGDQSESTAFKPVCTGSCTERRGMIPGALVSARRRSLVVPIVALAVDRDCRGRQQHGPTVLCQPARRRWYRCASPYRLL